MKKILKVTGIVAIALVALFIMTAGAYLLKNRSELARFRPVETGLVGENLFAVRDDFVNAFFIETGAGLVAIDAGNNAANLRKGMAALGLDPDKVVAVFLTHTDYDHTAGVSLFSRARVYISDREEQMVNGSRHRAFVFNNSLKVPHSRFADGDTISIGTTSVHAIVVPGHTPGMTCFLVDGTYLFSGDCIAVENGKAGPFNAFFNMDTAELVRNLGKVSHLDGVGFLVTAHYGIHDFASVMSSLR